MSKEEKAEGSSTGSTWWGSFIKSAKEKSLSAMEVIKSDLAEFTSTMSTDAASLITEVSSQSQNEQTGQTSSFFKTITKSISEITENFHFNTNLSEDTPETASKSTPKQMTTSVTSIHDRLKKDLELLQTNDQTFLSDPQDSNYAQWEENFNPDNFKSAISDLLIENSAMRLLYSQLVPAQISNIQFWSRYFFKVNQLEEEHKKRVKIIEKATTEAENEHKDSDWDDDDEPTPIPSVATSSQKEETPKEESKKIEVQKEEKEKAPVDQEKPDEKPEEKQEEKQVEKNENLPEDDKKQTLIQSISKTEDSDEWEKVSNLVVSENDDRTDYEEEDAGNKTQTDESSDKPKQESENKVEDLSKKRENLLSKLDKIDGNPANIDAEWDEWE